MSKLLRIKKYLSIEEAAINLSNMLEEPIKVADIYHLALENDLTMSVRLVDQSFAVIGRYIELNGHEAGNIQVDIDLRTGQPLDKPYSVCASELTTVKENQGLLFDKKVVPIDGIWDLAMIGSERQKLYELYQNEVGGEAPRTTGLNGFFLKRGDTIFRAKNSLPLVLDDNYRDAFQMRLNTLLASRGLTCNDVINDPYALDSLKDEELEEYWSLAFAVRQVTLEDSVEGLPFDSGTECEETLNLGDLNYQFVIRTDELSRVVSNLFECQASRTTEDLPLAVKERNTYLKLIHSLLIGLEIDPTARGAATPIQKITELAGEELSNETIRKILIKIKEQLP
ncbi:hypothetical protein [Vibrio mediterranei]|uniref:Uncharacterized protein n=1 Tax=Vibrio mediterranei TaxID=689 RepID=A0AAN1KQI7_9VIBR|nr:hypothetical protein [Vibrio mediterranei]ASI92519.1 hypothetical protein BSZ05_22250 [Vibrio mediterranei]